MSRKHPVKQGTASRKYLEKSIPEFLDAHIKEADSRYEALISKSDEVYFKLREDIIRTAESVLPKKVLDINLFDFIHGISSADGSMAECSEENGARGNVIDIASDATIRLAKLRIPVEEIVGNEHNEVEVSSKVNDFMPSFPFLLPGYRVHTPLQQNMGICNLPSVIRPKIDDVRERHFRAAKGNEVAFSVDGSPIVALPGSSVDQSTLLMKQIIESEEDAFSPNSREVVSMFKSLMRKKMAQAESDDPCKELD